MFFSSRFTRSVQRNVDRLCRRTIVQQSQPPPPRSCDPLRILFFGSEQFSIESLKALHAEQSRLEIVEPRGSRHHVEIASIDVVCRPGKRTGRRLQTITYPLIHGFANHDIGLPVHEVDSFDMWTPPEGINLIIAVSFGLLIPYHVIQKAKYGALNVHPSMLPDLRGAAPIEHALLQRREYTGVSVQTLHPTKFDGGQVIAQTPSPGIRIEPETDAIELRSTLAKAGASLLVEVLRDGAFLKALAAPKPHVQNDGELSNQTSRAEKYTRAPKITKEDRYIDWNALPSQDSILLRDRVLGRLWDDTTYAQATGSSEQKRIVYDRWERVPASAEPEIAHIKINESMDLVRTTPVTNRRQKNGGTFSVRLEMRSPQEAREETAATQEKYAISPTSFTIQYGKTGCGAQELARDVMRHRNEDDRAKLLC